MIKPELLAPAGSMDALHAAVDNGANAVYLGIGSFNARANAENFTLDDLPEVIEYAHLHSVLVYLALNTLLREDELESALELAGSAYSLGVDAVIVQDPGLLSLLVSRMPQIPIHASTQMNLFDSQAVQWAGDNGISRIVLPRELSVDEITARALEASRAGIEVEVFIHGALCVCYSGLCLFSAMNGNGQRSGNRGLCAQPCRTLFKLHSSTGGEELSGRLLSPKDQSALVFIRQLMEAGVHSLKIEGRMKEPAYVAATVRAYREYIDRIYEGENPSDAADEIQRHLLLAFNRGGSFTTQYMQGVKKGNLPAGSYSGRYGLILGIVVKKNARAGTLTLRISSEILPVRGDYLSIRVNDREIASFPIGKVEKLGDLLVVMGLHPQMIEKIPDGAQVYQMSELSYTRDLLAGKAAYKTPVALRLKNIPGDPLEVSLQLSVIDGVWNGTQAEITLSADLEGSYPELSFSRITDQLSKAKSSPFDVKAVYIDSSFVLKAPVSFINELRREAFAALEKQITDLIHPVSVHEKADSLQAKSPACKCVKNTEASASRKDILHVNYYDLRRLVPQKLGVRADYYSFSIYDVLQNQVQGAIRLLLEDEPSAKFLLWLPGAYKDTVLPVIEKAVGMMKQEFADAFRGVVTGSSRNADETTWINASANLYNHESLCTALSALPFAVSPSYEIKDQNLSELLSMIPAECFTSSYLSLHRYGRIEWMQSEFCPVGRNEPGCRKCRDKDTVYSVQILSAEDSEPVKGKDLPVVTHAEFCTSEILGPVHPSAGLDLLASCKTKSIPVAHTVRFLDEPFDVRRHITNEIISSIE